MKGPVADGFPEPTPPPPGLDERPTLAVREPRWSDVLLVCKACGKRGSGPTKLKPKALASLLKKGTKTAGRRTRIVMTECLGLCPKDATTVAVVGPGVATRLAAIRSKKQVDAALAALGADA